MFTGSDGFSLSDLAAVVKNDDGSFGGNGIWWLIIILLLFGWNGNGYGNQDSGVADNYVLTSDFSSLSRQMENGFDGIKSQVTAVADGICSLGYDQLNQMNNINTNISTAANSVLTQMNNNAVNAMQDNFAIQTAINGVNVNGNTNTQALLAQMNANEANRQACCCETNNAIATNFGNLKYDMAAQDCQIRQTVNDVGRSLADVQNANTQTILAAIQKISDDAKDEKIATLQSQVTQMQNMADNAAQTVAFTNAINNAVDELRQPTPIPAFSVNPPFYYGSTGCSCGA